MPSISLSPKHYTHTHTHAHASDHQDTHTHTHLPQALGPLLYVGSGCVDVVLYAVNLLLLGLMHRGYDTHKRVVKAHTLKQAHLPTNACDRATTCRVLRCFVFLTSPKSVPRHKLTGEERV